MENEKIIEAVTRHDEQIKELKKDVIDLKDITKLIYEISSDIKLLFQQSTNTVKDVGEIKTEIGEMKKDISDVKIQPDKKDAKKWNGLVKQVVMIVVSAIVGIALAKIGLI